MLKPGVGIVVPLALVAFSAVRVLGANGTYPQALADRLNNRTYVACENSGEKMIPVYTLVIDAETGSSFHFCGCAVVGSG